jgi:hypothetical protein
MILYDVELSYDHMMTTDGLNGAAVPIDIIHSAHLLHAGSAPIIVSNHTGFLVL